MTIQSGFTEDERPTVADMYWSAFSGKLGMLLGAERGRQFVQRVLDPRFALVARDAGGAILGVAGFKTADGAMVDGTWQDVRAVYGSFGGVWRAPLLELLARSLAPDTLLMDGICVASHARGLGVGTALLAAIKTAAQERGLACVRLDVINTNPRARALYEREGFVAQREVKMGPLRHIFGFASATEMLWTARR